MSDERIEMQHLVTLEGFAYAVYISDERMVCAAKDGDNSYPRLLIWRSGRDWSLIPQIQPHMLQAELHVRLSSAYIRFLALLTSRRNISTPSLRPNGKASPW